MKKVLTAGAACQDPLHHASPGGTMESLSRCTGSSTSDMVKIVIWHAIGYILVGLISFVAYKRWPTRVSPTGSIMAGFAMVWLILDRSRVIWLSYLVLAAGIVLLVWRLLRPQEPTS